MLVLEFEIASGGLEKAIDYPGEGRNRTRPAVKASDLRQSQEDRRVRPLAHELIKGYPIASGSPCVEPDIIEKFLG
jgi:hypothetical protein